MATDATATIENYGIFDHPDDAADSAYGLMLQTGQRGDRVERYGWNRTIDEDRPGLPNAEHWAVEKP